MRLTYFLATVAALAFVAPANAATLYNNPLLSGAIASPGSVGFTAASGGTSGALGFRLNGFASLDGVNFYEDDFTLALNGSPILTLSYDLGGEGGNVIFSNLYGATITGGTFGFFQGGALDISIASLPLLVGNNSFTFSYDSPSGTALGGSGGHAGPQGTGDEAFGISNVLLTGTAVPEPASWALMLVGFGIVGSAMRGRQRNVRVSFS